MAVMVLFYYKVEKENGRQNANYLVFWNYLRFFKSIFYVEKFSLS